MTKANKHISTPRTKALRDERIAAGVCIRCGGPKELDSRFCTYHHEQHKRYLQRWAAKKFGKKLPALPAKPKASDLDLKFGKKGEVPEFKKATPADIQGSIFPPIRKKPGRPRIRPR